VGTQPAGYMHPMAIRTPAEIASSIRPIEVG
jgi:hypothetical protein